MHAWIPYLKNPLVFFSFILLLLIGLIKAFMRSGKLSKRASAAIIDKVLNGTFILALLVFAGTMTSMFSRRAQVAQVERAGQVAQLPQAAKIKFNSAGALVYIGAPETIFATVHDANDKQIGGGSVQWSSMNPEIAGVTSAGSFEGAEGRVHQGRIVGIAPGTALIEASRDGYSEKIQVTVSSGNRSVPPLRPLNELLQKK